MPRKTQGGKRAKKIKAPKIQVGNHQFTWGKGLSEIDDSTQLYLDGNFAALRYKLETDGYIFVRNVIPQRVALLARDTMLKQAAKDGSVINTRDTPYSLARMAKQSDNKTWQEGYCLDGITGTETNERDGIDIDAWMDIGPGDIMTSVYSGDELKLFWSNLFGNSVNPLTKQTFLRLMGDSATQEHADYYYFKKDTHIFSGKDGRDAIGAVTQYRIDNNLEIQTLDPNIENTLQIVNEMNNNNNNLNINNKDILYCHICENKYIKNSLDSIRLKRFNKGGFGVSGEWHCPKCASKSFGIYTTWISLSNLEIPKDSILALCPKSHYLKLWDIPKPKDKQLCGDFNWKLPWVIPTKVKPGDIIIFNIKTIHASSLNVTNPRTFRVSCDTRILLTQNGNNNKNRKNKRIFNKNKVDMVDKSARDEKEFIDITKRNNPSPHPPLSVVKKNIGNRRKVIEKEKRDGDNNGLKFGDDEDSDEIDESDASIDGNDSECKSDGDSQDEDDNNQFDNDNDNDSGNENRRYNYVYGYSGNNKRPRMMTRAQARRLKQMEKEMEKNGNKGELKRISKENKGGSKDNTDSLTDSMSDLNLIA